MGAGRGEERREKAGVKGRGEKGKAEGKGGWKAEGK